MKSFKDWLNESMGTGPYIGNCCSTKNYQVYGACSDQNTNIENKAIRDGKILKKNRIKENAEIITKPKKWKATKDEILDFWRKLDERNPIKVSPIPYQHKGSTYGEDGIRITGTPEFIATVLPRLKEFLPYESTKTKLALVYRETESPSKMIGGPRKTSYVFYLQVKERGEHAIQ